MAAIGRFGTRVVPELSQIIAECRTRKQLVQGPCIERFEQAFARFLGSGHVRTCSTEYGRMALYFILKALDLPPDSEVIVPAFTFWVVPEMVRVAGLTPVFADVDPGTFTLSPHAFERAITPNTRAVLPTHLYGLSCDMDAIVEIARRHDLKVIEDCAHSLGATYNGRMVGTLGDASFFSFQAFKPLNTYGGGRRQCPEMVVQPSQVLKASWDRWGLLGGQPKPARSDVLEFYLHIKPLARFRDDNIPHRLFRHGYLDLSLGHAILDTYGHRSRSFLFVSGWPGSTARVI